MSEPIYDARTLWELLERRVADSPDRAFLIDDADRTVTFGEAKDLAERMAAGFSGTGLMHAPAVGQIVADLIREGSTSALDISALQSSRFGNEQTVVDFTGF